MANCWIGLFAFFFFLFHLVSNNERSTAQQSGCHMEMNGTPFHYTLDLRWPIRVFFCTVFKMTIGFWWIESNALEYFRLRGRRGRPISMFTNYDNRLFNAPSRSINQQQHRKQVVMCIDFLLLFWLTHPSICMTSDLLPITSANEMLMRSLIDYCREKIVGITYATRFRMCTKFAT